MYYYGARYYDPKLSIWMSVDPLAELHPNMTPYNYCSNNPINRIDPNGLTDFTVNKETGEVKQHGKTNDQPDRVLKTDSKGNVKMKGEGFLGFLVSKSERGKEKVAIDNIKQGILKDGLNLQENSNHFNINGVGQPTLADFDYFISKYSDYIGKEISGVRVGEQDNSNVTGVVTYMYKNNKWNASETPTGWLNYNGRAGNRQNNYIKSKFHTHPFGDHTPSGYDNDVKTAYPGLPYFIIAGGKAQRY